MTTTRTCPEHTTPDPRGSSHQRGYGQRWRKARARFLNDHPWCKCGQRATDAHHLDGLGPNGPRGYDPANLQALCHSCHSKITAGGVL